ncbi:triose-phosphate isomerase [Proteinivorax hydrogeniformans]|uniref:Triosephosphate isomerase n=1 Tax=Proteinivorax hydrogeniformans TaxID=1826727 RepID=A0AAU8HV47_9FIRM
MTNRIPILAGNWKMNKTASESEKFFEEVAEKLDVDEVEAVVCPPFTSLQAAKSLLSNSSIKLGAQNVHFEEKGAYTGEISPDMLKDLGVEYVIVGHSERRAMFGESDEIVNKKVLAVINSKMKPILCVGETLEEKEDNKTEEVCKTQVEEGLKGLTKAQLENVVIAYEPVWAIGTGKSATKEDANETIAFIRNTVKEFASNDVAQQIRIQYGGSVKPENISDYMAMSDIDGALVGGASLKVPSFVDIVKF